MVEQPQSPAIDAPEEQEKKKLPRTLGQRTFDKFIYGGVINTLVFGTSVVATFLSRDGHKFARGLKNQEGLVAKFCRAMEDRSQALENVLVDNKIMGKPAAENFRMVFWSFLDGSIFAILAKPLEDQRNNIARWIDTKFSKEPVNEESYKQEPKQGWLSVAGGRIATFSIVFPTYLLLNNVFLKHKAPMLGELSAEAEALKQNPGAVLDKAKNTASAWLGDPQNYNRTVAINALKRTPKIKGEPQPPVFGAEASELVNLNDSLFARPGKWVGEKLEKNSWMQRHFPKLTNPDSSVSLGRLFEVGFFEAFYTSVCTAGLYFGSRLFATKLNKNEDVKTAPASLPTEVASPRKEEASAAITQAETFVPEQKEPSPVMARTDVEASPTDAKPRTRIHEVMSAERQASLEPQLAGA
jgi:hypothetical protein